MLGVRWGKTWRLYQRVTYHNQVPTLYMLLQYRGGTHFCCPKSRNSPSLCSRFRLISSSSTAVISTQEIISMHFSLKNPSSISSSIPKEVLVSSSAVMKDTSCRSKPPNIRRSCSAMQVVDKFTGNIAQST